MDDNLGDNMTIRRSIFATLAAAVITASTLPVMAATVKLDFVIEIVEGTEPGARANAAGTQFDGFLTYDDADLTPGLPFLRDAGNGALTLFFPFLSQAGATFNGLIKNDSEFFHSSTDVARVFDLFATFSSDGSLTELNFSLDIPNEFFIISKLVGVGDFSGLAAGVIGGSYDISEEFAVLSDQPTRVLDGDGNPAFDDDGKPVFEFLPLRDDRGRVVFEGRNRADGFFTITPVTAVAPVPLPAAGTLLFTTMIGGMVIARRKRART